VLPGSVPAGFGPENIDEEMQNWKATLPNQDAGGVMIDYPWDLVEHNPEKLCEDWNWFSKLHPRIRRPEWVAVTGPEDEVVIAKNAVLDPFVLIDTREGPVLIDHGASIHSFTRLEGPCYIGPGCQVLGAKVRGGTLGPHCRVGGELEASILQGYTNKYHDGFLGHSYLGEWVNMAAGTQISDLRNDYGQIHVIIGNQRMGTGLNKVGVFIGDHTKTGLNTLFNCGTVVGAFCNLLPTGSLQPQLVPSFCRVVHGQLQEWTDLRQIFTTASVVMRRRDCELTETHTDHMFWLYEQTAPYRQQVIRESEQRRLRRSV
jgi:UDP-N-acetylglucosamine diphosphorylase/glucosamine-1-phosphate N-acetyltransferase